MTQTFVFVYLFSPRICSFCKGEEVDQHFFSFFSRTAVKAAPPTAVYMVETQPTTEANLWKYFCLNSNIAMLSTRRVLASLSSNFDESWHLNAVCTYHVLAPEVKVRRGSYNTNNTCKCDDKKKQRTF